MAFPALRSANCPELNQCFWEYGVDFVRNISDWAILNDTKPKQLERILSEFHHLSQAEIDRACLLLESYHCVYRRDRLEQRRNQLTSARSRKELKPCSPPTPAQLYEIALRVNGKGDLTLATQEVIYQLQDIAQQLREYCFSVKPGKADLKASTSLDRPTNHYSKHDRTHSDGSAHNNGYVPFLQMYPA